MDKPEKVIAALALNRREFMTAALAAAAGSGVAQSATAETAGSMSLPEVSKFYPSPLVLTSPDKQLVMHFSLLAAEAKRAQGGRLVYSLAFRRNQIVDNSGLALLLGDQVPLGADVNVERSWRQTGADDYSLLCQKVSRVHSAYNSLIVDVVERTGAKRRMSIEARAYNDGVAFRYLIPQQDAIQSFELRQEKTEFRLSIDATTWSLELPNYRSSYESEYIRLVTSAFSNQGGVPSHFLIGLPMLIRQPGRAWMALMEAHLEGSAAMYLTNPSGSWAGHWFVSELSPRFDRPDLAVISDLPWSSAWRVILVADAPGRLLESTLVYNLNPSNRVADTSWIHPGKASWNWWVDNIGKDRKSAYTTKTMKYYVDFAAKSGFRYMMLDAGWSARGDITKLNGKVDVPQLVRYAEPKNVKVWVWLYSGEVMEQMHEAFPLYRKWGVAGVKIDFINRNDQQGIQFYYDVARIAAENHLMVDFHGTTTPWGIERTYPNVMSYEGVLGLENNKVGQRDSPVDRTVFAFTRSLAGPMDYTPGAFRNATEESFIARNNDPMVMGTRTQQLALYVVFQTPIQMVSDSPQTYAGQPAFQFIKDVPASWDETRVLQGEPGEFIVIARRHVNDWYLGSITNWTSRILEVPLNFLGTGAYMADIYEDGEGADEDPTQVRVRRSSVNAAQTLTLKLAKGGGCAIRFVQNG